MSSLRDRILVYVRSRKENEEQLRFITLLKAVLLDRTSAQSVNDFNETIQKFSDLKSSTKRKQKTAEDVKKLMDDFKVNFPKLKEKKLKNFKRAD